MFVVAGSAVATDNVAPSASKGPRTLAGFLESVERRALFVARLGVNERDDALDIVQDAMLTFVRSYANRPAAEWPPLFHRVLESRVRDHQRRRSVRQRFRVWFSQPPGDDEDAGDPLARVADEREAGPLQRAADRDTRSALAQAMRELPVRQREAFTLRVWDGLDVATTARAMGCSEGSVKTHLARALVALRRKLEACR
ncbi:MAG: RNA polymerase sigma factor [Lysobacterales bacterium]